MAEKSKSRQEFEKAVFEIMNEFDKTGYNAKRYKDLFDSMSNVQFDEYVNKMLDPKHNLHVELSMYGKGTERPPNLAEIEAIGHKFGIDLQEYLFMPFANPDDMENPVVSKRKAVILVLMVRKMQQMLSKKNSISGDTNVVNPLTGQVTGDSKSASLSDTQTNGLVATNQYATVHELLALRGDDTVAEKAMLNEIARDGECHLNRDRLVPSNKQSIRTVHYLLLGAGLTTDIMKRRPEKASSSTESFENTYSEEDYMNMVGVLYNDVEYGEETFIPRSMEVTLQTRDDLLNNFGSHTDDRNYIMNKVKALYSKERLKNYINAVNDLKKQYKGKLVPHNFTIGAGLDGLLAFGDSRFKIRTIFLHYNKLGLYNFKRSHLLQYTDGRQNKFGKNNAGEIWIVKENEETNEEIGRIGLFFNDDQRLMGIEFFGDKLLFTINNIGVDYETQKLTNRDKYGGGGDDTGVIVSYFNDQQMLAWARKIGVRFRFDKPVKHISRFGKKVVQIPEWGLESSYYSDGALYSHYFYDTTQQYIKETDIKEEPEKPEGLPETDTEKKEKEEAQNDQKETKNDEIEPKIEKNIIEDRRTIISEQKDSVDTSSKRITNVIDPNTNTGQKIVTTVSSIADNQIQSPVNASEDFKMSSKMDPKEDYSKYNLIIIGDNEFDLEYRNRIESIIQKYKPTSILHYRLPDNKLYSEQEIDEELEYPHNEDTVHILELAQRCDYPVLKSINMTNANILDPSFDEEKALVKAISEYYNDNSRTVAIIDSRYVTVESNRNDYDEIAYLTDEFLGLNNVLLVPYEEKDVSTKK